ncbi:hypothetical protein KC669_03630 [Candidatus Dojkabacteria bacterium]|uniref:Uncharacterized protein n=1 Tax=Candidatus Dojkabacteria bacterium TaxID=2099670 RepID=A0A955LAS9_9BACT|nr:hypothetical protein [Candidatus Dojkabacteria bacterium]
MSDSSPDNIINIFTGEHEISLDQVCILDYPSLIEDYKHPRLNQTKKLMNEDIFPEDGVVSFIMLKAFQLILYPQHNGLNSSIIDCIEFISSEEATAYQKDLLIWDCLRLNIKTVRDGIDLIPSFGSPLKIELLSDMDIESFYSTIIGLVSNYVRNQFRSNYGIRFLTNPRVNVPTYFDSTQGEIYENHTITFPKSLRFDSSILFALDYYAENFGEKEEDTELLVSIAKRCIKNQINTLRDVVGSAKVYNANVLETKELELLYNAVNRFIIDFLSQDKDNKIIRISDYL